jgi:SAM-dependent methyltransferase
MAKAEFIARQSGRPTGWFGQIVARVMALETAPANRTAVARLEPKPGEAILEVGCGHGKTLAGLAAIADFVAGIDASDVMVGVAKRRLGSSIAAGRAEVSLASSDAIPYEDGRFDAAFAVHVLYFWSDPSIHLREILRILKPGGRLLLGYRPRDADSVAALPASVYSLRTAEEVERILSGAGYVAARSTEHRVGGVRFVVTEGRAA